MLVSRGSHNSLGGGRNSVELWEEGGTEVRRVGGMSTGGCHEVNNWTTKHSSVGPHGSLPLIVSVAEVFS